MKKQSAHPADEHDPDVLTRRLAAGDPQAIELIYRHYFHTLLRYGTQVAGPHYQHQVEDVIQEFFIWLAQHCAEADRIRDLEVYMFQSVRRNLYARMSAEKSGQATFRRYLSRTLPLRQKSALSPEQLRIDKERGAHRKALLHRELDKLPASQREVLYLRYFEGKTHAEIASILSVSDQVVYNYIYRAIKRLKEQMADLPVFSLFLFDFLPCFA